MKTDREILESVIDTNFKGNQTSAAKAFRTPAAHINQILSGKKNLGYAVARRVEDFIGVGEMFIVTRAGKPAPERQPISRFERDLKAIALAVANVSEETGLLPGLVANLACAIIASDRFGEDLR